MTSMAILEGTVGDCWESGGPDWLFGASLGSAVFGVSCAVLWFVLLSLPEAQRRKPSILAKVPRPGLQAVAILGSAYGMGRGFYGDPALTDAGANVTVAIVAAAAMVGGGAVLLPSSQRVTSIRWSQLRTVPWYALLPLPLFSIGGFSITLTSVATMIYMGHPC